MRAGVYCCPFRASDMHYEDNFSLFRSGLWCLVNDLPPFTSDIVPPSKSRAFKLLKLVTEPAAVPHESPILSSSSSADAYDDAPDVAKLDISSPPHGYSGMVQVEDEDASFDRDPFDDVPSWVSYYMSNSNHPNVYIGDMIYDHRKLRNHLLVSPDMAVKPARNLIEAVNSTQQKAEKRTYQTSSGAPVVHRRQSSSARSSETFSDVLDRKIASSRDIEVSDTAPLKLKRGVRTVNGAVGTSYKALTVSGDYLVESGMLVAESSKVHPTLKPLPPKVAASLSPQSSVATCGRAAYYSHWVVARPLTDTNMHLEVASFSAADAWAVPPVSSVPCIDLHTQYHQSWQRVLAERVRHKQVLPMVVPAVGWPRRSVKTSGDLLSDALDRCEDPAYSVSEQQVVYRAWNVVAAKSASVAPCSDYVYTDAATLLSYMASADKLSRF